VKKGISCKNIWGAAPPFRTSPFLGAPGTPLVRGNSSNLTSVGAIPRIYGCYELYDAKTGAKHPGKNARRLATRRKNQARKDVDPLRRVVFTDGRMIRYMPGAPRK